MKRLLPWLPLLAWMTVIYFLSAQNSDSSSQLSGGVLTRLLDLLNVTVRDPVQAWLHEALRSLAHGLVFFILGWLAMSAIPSQITWPTWSAKQSAINRPTWSANQSAINRLTLSAAVCLLYAALDEWHQNFVPGRSCQWQDWLVDAAGISLAVLLQSRRTRFRPPAASVRPISGSDQTA